MKKMIVLIVALLLVAGTAMATPVSLVGYDPNGDGKLTYDELVALGSSGGTLQDKLFYNFTYSGSASGGAASIPASGVTVNVLNTLLDPGFTFTAAWSVIAGQTMDSTLNYYVKVQDGGPAIEDVFVGIGGFVATPNGVLNVAENVFSVKPDGTDDKLLATVSAHVNGGTQFQDTYLLIPPTMGPIHVIKDISLNGNDGSAKVSSVTNQFSEVAVPEPASMLLLGSGLIGLAGFARRKFKK